MNFVNWKFNYYILYQYELWYFFSLIGKVIIILSKEKKLPCILDIKP